MLTSPTRVALHGHGPTLPGVGRYGSGKARKTLWVACRASTEAQLPSSDATLHTVQDGETLAQIALAYGVSVEQIQEAMPRGSRSRRATLPSSTTLQPGQKILVASDACSSSTLLGLAAGARGLASQHGPVMSVCVGGALLAAGALGMLSFKTATDSPGAVTPAAAAAAVAPAATPSHVTSAVAEVRALLQDAAVGMQAVESALAAVRKATVVTGSSAPAEAATEAAVGVAAVAPVAAAASVETIVATVGPSAEVEVQEEAIAFQPMSEAVEVEVTEPPISEVAVETEVPRDMELVVRLPADAATAADVVAAMETPAADATALEAAVAAAPVVEAAGAPPADPWFEAAFDTAVQVAAARTRVQAALEAAQDLMLSVPLPGAQMQATAAYAAAVQLPQVTAEVMESAALPMGAEAAEQVLDRIRTINQLLEKEQQRADIAALHEEVRTADAEVNAPATAAAETAAQAIADATATTAEAVAAAAESAVDAVASAAEAAGEAIADATAATAEAVTAAAEAAVSAVAAVTGAPAAAAAAEVAAEAIAGATSATAESMTAAAEATVGAIGLATETAAQAVSAVTGAAVDATAAAEAAVASTFFGNETVLPAPSSVLVVAPGDVLYEAASPDVVAAMSARASGLLDNIDMLLASFEGFSEDDECALKEVEAAEREAAKAATMSGELLPPPATPGVPVELPSLAAAADSSTTAKLVLNLPSLPTPAPAAAAALASGAVMAGGAVSPAPSQPFMTAEALKAMVAPLSASMAGPVLDRIRDIGLLLTQDQEQRLATAASTQLPALAAAAALVEPVAAPTAREAVPVRDPWDGPLDDGTTIGGVPSSIIGALNRTFRTSSASSAGAAPSSNALSPGRTAAGLLRAPPTRPALSAPPQRIALPPAPPLPPLAFIETFESTAGAAVTKSATLPSTLPQPLRQQATPHPQPQMQPPPPPHAPPLSPPSSLPPSGGNPTLQRAVAAAAVMTATASQPQEPGTDGTATLVHLKSGLLDLVYGTARGVNATSVQRGAIEEFVTALEARNPHTVPTDAVSALSGRWKLVYTSNVGTLMLLGALDGMPLVDVGDVYQTVDPVTLTATNKIDIAVPMLLSLRAEAGLEVRSPRQFKVRFTKVGLDTFIATPQLMAALEIPASITVLGATLDLTPLRRLVEPINSGLEAAQGLLGLAMAPEFAVESVPVPPGLSRGSISDAASLWMLTTYLDDSLRISRDDEGRVFVMLKDIAWPGPDNAPRSPQRW